MHKLTSRIIACIDLYGLLGIPGSGSSSYFKLYSNILRDIFCGTYFAVCGNLPLLV